MFIDLWLQFFSCLIRVIYSGPCTKWVVRFVLPLESRLRYRRNHLVKCNNHCDLLVAALNHCSAT